jgi:hypothetical protein
MITRSIDPRSVPFHVEEAYRFLKVKRDSSKFALMDRMIRDLYNRHIDAFVPRYRYKICTVSRDLSGRYSSRVDDRVTFEGEGVQRLLLGTSSVAVFLLTVGPKVDEIMSSLAGEDFTETYFFDGVASAITIGILEVLREDLLSEAAKLRCQLGLRYSTGYAKWDLKEQEKIFTILNGREFGVTLTESHYMIPQKSLSGIFSLPSLAGADKGSGASKG